MVEAVFARSPHMSEQQHADVVAQIELYQSVKLVLVAQLVSIRPQVELALLLPLLLQDLCR